jgi:hypothetical protein
MLVFYDELLTAVGPLLLGLEELVFCGRLQLVIRYLLNFSNNVKGTKKPKFTLQQATKAQR